MAIQIAATTPARDGMKNPQLGWLAENDLDRAVLLHSHGRLQPYLPIFDTRRVDRAYVWQGIGRPRFVQVKSTTQLEGECEWRIGADHFTPYPRFSVVLCMLDRSTGRLDDVLWVVKSELVPRLAAFERNSTTRTHDYQLWANRDGRDRLAPYRRRLDQLWKKLAPGATLQATVREPAERLSQLRVEEGPAFEYAFVAECLRADNDDLLLFRPASDIAGRDLLVQMVDTPRALFMQVKGTRFLKSTDSIHILVRRHTFVPSKDFWLAFYYYDDTRQALFDTCWLVPSLEFARLTQHQRDPRFRSFEARLTPEADRWRKFRHPLRAQADVLRTALHRLPGR